MKAAALTGFGPPSVVQIQEAPLPEPIADQARVRVMASTVTSGDARIRAQNFPKGFGWIGKILFGRSTPKKPILGVEFSGIVDAVGPQCKRFAVGDAVFGITGAAMGAHAAYKLISEKSAVAKIPEGVSFEIAAALSFGGNTALSFLERAQPKPGERMLVVGASGTVGSAAVQIGTLMGLHVTGVCSGRNREVVMGLGAKETLDHTTTSFAEMGGPYDLIFDTIGQASLPQLLSKAHSKSRLLLVMADLPMILRAVWANLTGPIRMVSGPASETSEHLSALAQWAAEGRFRPLIDCQFPLEKIAEAHARVDTGRKVGSVVVQIGTWP